jgi:hypothetical protein
MAPFAATDWADLLLSAFGASIIGGLLGGLLTTWLRGRIEEKEAWRNRGIEAADEFMKLSGHTALLVGDLLRVCEDPHSGLIGADGSPSPRCRKEIQAARDANAEARIASNRIPILFGMDSDVADAARKIIQSTGLVLSTLEGAPEGRTVPEDMTRLEFACEILNLTTNVAYSEFVDSTHHRLIGGRRFYRSERI